MVNSQSPEYQVGHQQSFSLIDLESREPFTIEATLRFVTPKVYMYAQDGLNIPQKDIERSAETFEREIYPSVTAIFGQELVPGIDNDSHITILHAEIPGAAGYFSSTDEYPKEINPLSNEREIIYINVSSVKLDSPFYYSVLIHELQHAIHFRADPTEEVWINEGLSVLSEELNGYPSRLKDFFARSPDTQLNAWPLEPAESGPSYGAAYLFMKYLAQQYIGIEGVRGLVEEPADGIQGIEEYLHKKGIEVSFEEIFKDWVIANFLDIPSGGLYEYEDIDLNVRPTEKVSDFVTSSGTVHQYAADYITIELKEGDVRLTFEGNTDVKLLPNEPHSGAYQWWSNRGDAINATLTRGFDLSGLDKTTLRFWAWYDIEDNFDYAYVEVSTDGGATWSILPGLHTTSENPLGNSFGPAYTGISGDGEGPQWVEEVIDLSAYAGGEILLRFQYITDEAVNSVGFSVDDISIPQLGYFYDAEGDGGWVAQGFFRTDNSIAQRFIVQLIEFGDTTRVRDVPLDSQQRGEIAILGFGSQVKEAVLVVAAVSRGTTEVAHYQYSLTPLAATNY